MKRQSMVRHGGGDNNETNTGASGDNADAGIDKRTAGQLGKTWNIMIQHLWR